MLYWLGLVAVALTLVGCALLFIAVFGLIYLLGLHLVLRRDGIGSEARLLAQPLPPDGALPHVVVQIPVFNEGAIVERGIESAARLDWPKDKLHIQICDDSTDETTELARAAAQRAAADGIDAIVLHRDDRSEFKAGALRAAMAATPHDYFAILDVDYVPSPDFLRRCMAALLAEPKLAFVQARPDFLNADQNALTRAQAIILDFHYGLEQPTRSWANHALTFNGTCGVWRRAAIEAGGGWRGDMLTEDWDLSYRALLAGWRGVFVATVAVPGELPSRLGAWAAQQRRWAAGIGEVARKMALALASRTGTTTKERWQALFPLFTWLGYLMFAATFFLALVTMLITPSFALALGLTAYAAFVSATVALFGLMLAANRFLRRGTPLGPFVRDFAVAVVLCMYISWAHLRSLPATLSGHRRIFVRTPKEGSALSADRIPR
jgi:cellulose synthase/poly-beta-1,6-N-acetylglucosamine synthase-like glycosyltransferase